jgi:hypothetical protein
MLAPAIMAVSPQAQAAGFRMRTLLALLQAMAESLRRVRSNPPGSSASTEAYLKPLVILMIGLLAGPDIFVAVELTTILELLGATLFLLTFAVGFRMLGVAALEWLRKFLLPVEYVALIKMHGKPSARIYGAFLICRINCIRGLFVYCLCIVSYAGVCELFR